MRARLELGLMRSKALGLALPFWVGLPHPCGAGPNEKLLYLLWIVCILNQKEDFQLVYTRNRTEVNLPQFVSSHGYDKMALK